MDHGSVGLAPRICNVSSVAPLDPNLSWSVVVKLGMQLLGVKIRNIKTYSVVRGYGI